MVSDKKNCKALHKLMSSFFDGFCTSHPLIDKRHPPLGVIGFYHRGPIGRIILLHTKYKL